MTFPGKMPFFQANIKFHDFSRQDWNSMTFQGLYEPCTLTAEDIRMKVNPCGLQTLIYLCGPLPQQRSYHLKLAWKKQRASNQVKKWSSRWSSPTSEAIMNLRLWSTSTLILPLTHHPVPVESKPSVTHMMLTVRQTRKKLPLLALRATVNHPWDLLSPEMTQTKYPMTEKRMTEAKWSPFVHSTTNNNVAMGYQAKDVQEPIPLSAENGWTMESMRITTRLKSSVGIWPDKFPPKHSWGPDWCYGLCLLRVSQVWRLFAQDLRRWI